MFNRCRGWRRMLSRRADGTLSLQEEGALENHLAHCLRCQKAAEADTDLRIIARTHTGLLDDETAQAFDSRVLATLHSTLTKPIPLSASSWHTAWTQRMTRWSRVLPSSFVAQLAGGGLVAAGVTALCFLPVLRSGGSRPHVAPDPFAGRATTSARAGQTPIPLDSLLRNPAPRAALMWGPTDRDETGQNGHTRRDGSASFRSQPAQQDTPQPANGAGVHRPVTPRSRRSDLPRAERVG